MDQTNDEKQFLQNYDASQYERPSVTTDMAIFTINETDDLCLLLIRRGDHPYKGCWALPGGFLNAGKESTEQTAARELFEETGIQNAFLKQLYTFSRPDRDPRTHVISVAYTALIPKSQLIFQAGDDAKDARLFRISYGRDLVLSDGHRTVLLEKDLAFDHAEIIKTAIERLRGRIDYEPDAFELLADKKSFTIYELKRIYETIRGQALDLPNFRKMFFRNYVKKGLAAPTGAVDKKNGRRDAALYKLI